MPKIGKIIIVCILAFFILDGFLFSRPSDAQGVETLENGLRVIIEEDHRNPIVVFSVLVDVGSASEGEYSGCGISHLIEHMLFKGTRKYPPGTIENILHIYGGNIEGWTSYDYTGFRITILKEHKAVAIDILKEMLSAPTFNPKELKKEMQVIEHEMELTTDDPVRRISRLTFSNAYLRHPYRMPVIGYKENFERLDRKALIRFFRANYTPEKIIIAVVGDIDKKTILSDIEKAFGKIPRGKNIPIVSPSEPEQIAERYVEEKADVEGVYLDIAFPSTGLLNKDLYALDILSFILGQGESSILNKNIRIEKGLVLSVSASNYTPKDPGLFIISSVLKEKNVKSAIDGIIKEVNIVKEKGVTAEELVKAKNNFLSEYIFQKETIGSKANDMATGVLLAGDPRFFEDYIEHIKSVSLDDIQRVAKKYLQRDSMTVAALSRHGNILNPAPEAISQKQKREIKKIMLENNLPVLICENPALPVVSICLLIKGGVRVETEKDNGISKTTSLMLMDGMDSMTREDIAMYYESKGMTVKTYSANNSLGISVNCLKEDAVGALRLISDLCLNSIFPEKELEREKKELKSIVDMQDDQIFNQGQRRLKKLLFKTHPYKFQAIGTHESIDRIKRKDVLSFCEGVISAKNMVLGICGDCNIQDIEPAVEKYFSEFPSKKPNLHVPAKEMPMGAVREVLERTGKEQSLLLLGFYGASVYSKDKYAIEVMVNILSSSSGILFKSIREKSGLSYATGAFQVSGLDPGYIIVYALTSRQNIDNVKSIIFKEIPLFTRNGPTDKEMLESKNQLKAMHLVTMQTNASFIFKASLDELYGLGYNNYKNYGKNIDKVTKEDVKRVAKKLLTLDRCALVILEGREGYSHD